MEHSQSLDEQTCVTEALKFGRQAYLQRRISSEASIGKLLFKNGFKMLQSRQLTEAGDEYVAEQRIEQARQLRDLLRRLELIRALRESTRAI
jgi:glycerol-3-phosphate O-acyltransferase